MDVNDNNGHPPFPGYGQQGGQQTSEQPTTVREQAAQPVGQGVSPTGPDANKQKEEKPHKDHHTLKGLVAGIVGGAAAALLVVFGLSQAGVIGGSSSTTQSSAGQAVTINASTQDASVAQAVASKCLPSVVTVQVTTSEGEGLGSGVIYDTKGNIITNYHVIDGAKSISVTINDKSYDATVVGSDSSSDLAVIHVDLDGASVTPMEMGDSDKLTVGSWVMSIGSPFGLDQSVSAGIVSAISRNELMQSSSGNTLYTNLIQVDADVNPGNSGGALVDSEGKLVGICTLYTSDSESFAGIGFAIPSNYAKNVADQIIAGKTVTHAYIGLTMQTVNAATAQANNLSVNQGAYVVSVTDGSPAADAGIKAGDIITSFDGESITSADGMILAVRSKNIGDTVEVKFMRGNSEKTVQVKLGSDENLQKEQKNDTSNGLVGQDDSGSDQNQQRNENQLQNQNQQQDTNGYTNNQLEEIYDYLNRLYGGQ